MDKGAESYRRFREEGDEQGLVELIRDYKDGLIFYLNSFTGDFTVAEELCEDTFVLLGTKKPKDRGTGSFKTWLYTIGRNIAIDYLRKQRRRGEVPLSDDFDISDEEAGFENGYIAEEDKQMLYRAMKRLKPEYRQILWLVYFEEFSMKDAAAVIKKSVHATETLTYRARLTLRMELEEEGFTYEGL